MIKVLLKAMLTGLAPGLSAALAVARATLSVLWTFVRHPPGSYLALLGIAALSWWLSGSIGYGRGEREATASAAVLRAQEVARATEAARADGYLRGSITRRADLDYAYQQGRNDAAALTLPQKVVRYVPQVVTADCVPNGLVKLLDAAGLGVSDPDALPGAAAEPDQACSDLSLPQAVTLLVNALSERRDFEDRLNNIKQWADKQTVQNKKGTGGDVVR